MDVHFLQQNFSADRQGLPCRMMLNLCSAGAARCYAVVVAKTRSGTKTQQTSVAAVFPALDVILDVDAAEPASDFRRTPRTQ